ncbi:MAG: glycosyltransferase family A protein [Oceanospirillaceae bacterium]
MSYSVVVIIPMYNSASTIKRALSSLENQTVLVDRVVVIDDGSTDNSCEIVNQFSLKTSFTLDIIKQKNAGPSAARNTGIEHSIEDLIFFLDADDEWLPTKLEKQLELYASLIKSKKNVGLIDCFLDDIKDNISVIRMEPVFKGNHFKDFIIRNSIKGTSCVMVPRKVLEVVGGFDSNLKYAEDRMLWSSIAEKYELYTVEDILAKRYYGGEGNITSHPTKNYILKKKFIEFFISKFKSKLTEDEIVKFTLYNLNEFLVSFYSNKDYENVIVCYREMFEISNSTIWFSKFYPTAKYLVARIKLKI